MSRLIRQKRNGGLRLDSKGTFFPDGVIPAKAGIQAVTPGKRAGFRLALRLARMTVSAH